VPRKRILLRYNTILFCGTRSGLRSEREKAWFLFIPPLAHSLLLLLTKSGNQPPIGKMERADMNRRLIDYNPEGYGAEGEVLLFGMAPRQPQRSSGEIAELAFASAFLDADNLASIGRLINRLVRYAGVKTGRPISYDVARVLAQRLGRAASMIWRLLPTRKITPPGGGSELATSAAERVFGTEFEGLSAEDQEFETARYFVRFALGAMRAAALAPPGRPPALVAAIAERIAARRYAPGLVGTVTPTYPGFRYRRAVRRSFL